MLLDSERKILMRALRFHSIRAISLLTEVRIEAILQSDILNRELTLEIWNRAQQRLREQGHADLCEKQRMGDWDPLHATRTIYGNMQNAVDDMREPLPEETNREKLKYWDNIWKEEKSKNKRARNVDPTSLPKKVRIIQDQAAAPEGRVDTSGTGVILRTCYNAQCSHMVGIPHEALVMGARIGGGAFGECRRINVKGISFFPDHITYCGKCYKGDAEKKFDNFQTEQGMQVLHPSIVRCIAFTMESPWITLFPLYNGGSIGDMLLLAPFQISTFRRVIHRLEEGWKSTPLKDTTLTDLQLNQIKAVVANIPNIMHAIVEGMAAVHMSGIIHTDLHPFNLVLDFTRDLSVRVGIIDWGLMLRLPKKRPSLTYVYDAQNHPDIVAEKQTYATREQTKRPWLAPELLSPFLADAYSKASDVYSLGYVLEQLYDFWKIAHRTWMRQTLVGPPDAELLDKIHSKVRNWMLLERPEERRPVVEVLEFFRSLKTEAARAQRPLVELMPAFYTT